MVGVGESNACVRWTIDDVSSWKLSEGMGGVDHRTIREEKDLWAIENSEEIAIFYERLRAAVSWWHLKSNQEQDGHSPVGHFKAPGRLLRVPL